MNRVEFSIRRHEEKGSDGLLTEQGKQNAFKIGKGINGALLALYHSDRKQFYRTVQTAEEMCKGHEGRVVPELIHEATLLDMLDPPFPQGIEDRDEIFDYWLDGEYLIDGKPGPMYIAGANILKHLLGVIPRYSKSEGTIESITSAPNIESAIVMILDPGLRMKQIGGSVKTGENAVFTVDYSLEGPTFDYSEQRHVTAVNFRFRDFRREINHEILNSLAYNQ